jgi:hypothetical protein
MNSAIAVSTTTAPIVITSAFEPLRPPPPEVALVAVRIVGVDVLGVVTGDSGTPGENGLLVVVWAPAREASIAVPRTASSRQIRHARGASTAMGRFLVTAPTLTDARQRSDASGCSIAGVWGGSRYGCSFSECSSWYTLSTLTDQMSWLVPSRMLSTARIEVSIEWSELL